MIQGVKVSRLSEEAMLVRKVSVASLIAGTINWGFYPVFGYFNEIFSGALIKKPFVATSNI